MDDRVRKKPGNIRSLANSLRDQGIMHPIVLHEGRLIAGWRRCMATLLLKSEEEAVKGHKPGEISYLEKHDLSEYDLLVLEYAENRERKPFEKAEEALAIERLKVELERVKGKKLTNRQLAKEIGCSTSQITFALNVAEAVGDDSPLSEKEKKKVLSASSIAGAYRDLKSNEKLKELLARAEAAEEEAEESGEGFDYGERLVCGDIFDVLPSFPDETFDLIQLDPPWGIGIDSYDRNRHYGTFDDTTSVAEEIADFLIPEAFRLLKEDTYLILWHGIQFYAPLMDRLSEAGFKPNPVPYLWYKTDKKGSQNDPTRTVINAYEPFIVAEKGEPRMYVKTGTNVLEHSMPPKRIHFAQKPVSLLKEVIRKFSFGKMRVLDPTFGSGSFLVAAQTLGREFYGVEKKQDNYDNALNWLKTSRYVDGG